MLATLGATTGSLGSNSLSDQDSSSSEEMGSDETDEPFAFNDVFRIYIALLQPGVGIEFSSFNCLSLFHAVKNYDLEEIILEYEEVAPFIAHEGFNCFLEVLIAPFRGAHFGQGALELVWYEKNAMINIFNFLRCLQRSQAQYKVMETAFPFP